jgi:hypothetical protein
MREIVEMEWYPTRQSAEAALAEVLADEPGLEGLCTAPTRVVLHIRLS